MKENYFETYNFTVFNQSSARSSGCPEDCVRQNIT